MKHWRTKNSATSQTQITTLNTYIVSMQKRLYKNHQGDSQGGTPLEAVGGFKRGDRNPPFAVFGSFLPQEMNKVFLEEMYINVQTRRNRTKQ